jgi:hypothetical protein
VGSTSQTHVYKIEVIPNCKGIFFKKNYAQSFITKQNQGLYRLGVQQLIKIKILIHLSIYFLLKINLKTLSLCSGINFQNLDFKFNKRLIPLGWFDSRYSQWLKKSI